MTQSSGPHRKSEGGNVDLRGAEGEEGDRFTSASTQCIFNSLYHPSLANQPLISWGHDEMPCRKRQLLPALSEFENACLQAHVIDVCGRSEAKCGRTLKEGYREDNNSRKKQRLASAS